MFIQLTLVSMIHINKKYLFSLLLLLYVFVCKSHAIDDKKYGYGLTFWAHSTNQDQRTSLELAPDAPLHLPCDGFSLEFDIKLRKEVYTYGYVTRIISNDSSCLDLISYLVSAKVNVVFTDDGGVVENKEFINPSCVMANKWMHVNIRFTPNSVYVQMGKLKTVLPHTFKSFKNIKIYFGGSKHSHFFSTDVAPMTIRNIVISDNKGKELRKWRLAQHDRNSTLDSIEGAKALVKNGIWEIDKHTKWALIESIEIDNINPQSAYDDVGGRIFIASSHRLYIYNLYANRLDSVSFAGHPYMGVSSQMIYDRGTDRLISYSPTIKKLNFYDFKRRVWSSTANIVVTMRQHHNRFIDSTRKELVLFGGYGQHHYNALLSRVPLDGSKQWHTISLAPMICPRYLSALCVEDEDNVLIMGGHGSKSGKQEESPTNFYDLYRLNFHTGMCRKLWDFQNDKDHFAFGNSMVLDSATNSVYALTYNNDRYNTFLYLSRFNINAQSPAQQIMGDSIIYNFLDIHSYCDLFLCKPTSSLYAIVMQGYGDNNSKISFYRLAFPPILEKDVLPHYSGGYSFYLVVSSLIITFMIVFLIIVLRTMKEKKKTGMASLTDAEEKLYGSLDDTQPVTIYEEKGYSKILLVGGFLVTDKRGQNITGEFTPTLKHLFLFLFLNSMKDERGTTSECLDETFWFDMSKSNASNNRNVNIRKLRLIVDRIGGVSISSRNGYWNLSLHDEVVCDYRDIMQILSEFRKRESSLTREKLELLVSRASGGVLLPNISSEWLDEYKSEYGVAVTETLLSIIDHPAFRSDMRLLLKIADVVLAIDSIDEDAIRLKCRILNQMGQKGLSKQSFDKFCNEYERLLNTHPDFSYKDIAGFS